VSETEGNPGNEIMKNDSISEIWYL